MLPSQLKEKQEEAFLWESVTDKKNWLVNFATLLSLAVPALLILGPAAADIAMSVTAILFLISSAMTGDWKWVRTPWFLLACVTTIYLLVSGVMADFNRHTGIERALTWPRFPVFTMAFSTWILPRPLSRKLIMPVLVATLLFVSIDTAWQMFFGKSLTGHLKPTYPGRLSGPFDPKLIPGTYLVRLCWPAIGLVFAVSQRHRMSFVLSIIFLAVMGGVVLISGERIAFALFGLSALVFIMGAPQLRNVLLAIGMICLAAGCFTVWYVPSLHQRLVNETSGLVEHFDQSSYTTVWNNGLIAWHHSPILGVGPKNFVAMCEKLGTASGFAKEFPDEKDASCTRHPHNIYLEWLAETGMIGLALFLGMIILWIRQGWRRVRTSGWADEVYYPAWGALVGLIPFLWPLMSSMSFFINWSACLFWWSLSLTLASNPVKYGTKK